MRIFVKALAWLFVVAVTTYDASFMSQYGAYVAEWELNPFARMLVAVGGVEAAVIFRFATIAFAVVVFILRRSPKVTAFMVAVHTVLVFMYLG